MPATIFSSALVGLDAFPIEVEVDLSRGLHLFAIVGLPDKAVEESKERVSSAIKNSGLVPPNRTNRRVIVNLAPADLKKEGPKYDLPIALSYLVASGQVSFAYKDKMFVGELALDGSIRPVSGVLAIAFLAQKEGFTEIYVPPENAHEAALIKGLRVYAPSTLADLVAHLEQTQELSVVPHAPPAQQRESKHDFAYIKGQEQVKRGLEIAAAGGHNILMSGPPGSGKTLLARALVSILPHMTWNELLEVTRIYSVAGLMHGAEPLVLKRPFRSPHHSASAAALVGGGSVPRPGEITLAHRGVLFLDEFPEFSRRVLESLRQPLEDGVVTVSRVRGTLSFPARFMLVATMNPCPCGFLNDERRPCICTPYQIARYRRKLSGPLLDRIDLHVHVPRVRYEKLSSHTAAESSRVIQKRINHARAQQEKRFAPYSYTLNNEMPLTHIKRFCETDAESKTLLKRAMEHYSLSARAYHRILKMSRTIADLAEAPVIINKHIAEALQFRPHEESRRA